MSGDPVPAVPGGAAPLAGGDPALVSGAPRRPPLSLGDGCIQSPQAARSDRRELRPPDRLIRWQPDRTEFEPLWTAFEAACDHFGAETVPKRVAFGEPESILRIRPQVQVNGNARGREPSGVFLTRCRQRLTAATQPAGALSVPRGRGWGPSVNVDGCCRRSRISPRTLGLSVEQPSLG